MTYYSGKNVFLTGHTGFKGSWLALWLDRLGARVHGYALDPPAGPCLFGVAEVRDALDSDVRADVGDLAHLKHAMTQAAPEIVFHLAAQPLVRASYRDPLSTLATNVMGTAHLLEAVRGVGTVKAVVVVTTDKVYENREWPYPYREADALGGHDPYSASKAAAEIVAASYRASFFGEGGHTARVATARAGNVIGGGDWAADRLVPDCLRAFAKSAPVHLRFPDAVRPWQHVLEPLAGYLRLGECLAGPDGARYAKAWNFGPEAAGYATVGEVARAAARAWGKGAKVEFEPNVANPHEAGLLRLDSTLARAELGWKPSWSLDQAISQTVAWHRAWMRGRIAGVCQNQIDTYEAACQARIAA